MTMFTLWQVKLVKEIYGCLQSSRLRLIILKKTGRSRDIQSTTRSMMQGESNPSIWKLKFPEQLRKMK
jgi:hypothetical protein